ncbi:MAG TPA: EAL domain-containing protein [Candidatus Limnocylindrales bacterium]|nr:EAL domain-containing protein [Candidatus Limnocylindrales bacterium]
MRRPIADTLLGALLGDPSTRSHRDVGSHVWLSEREGRLAHTPWRAAIGTPFTVGRTAYFLGFASPEPLDEGFSALDHSYVETLATLCAAHLQQRAQYERLRYQAEHDPLTGLLNAAAFRARGIAAYGAGRRFALAVADVDEFRMVNERLGHQTGDALLVEVAARMAQRAAPADVVARLGGDHFGIMIDGAHTRADAERRLHVFSEAFREPFETGDRDRSQRISLTASIGIALSPQDGDYEDVLARADAAVYEAKHAGRARWAFFDRRIERNLSWNRRMKDELMHALLHDELVLYFQPHVELATGRVVGAEALVRWQHRERGLLPPSEFVPFADSHGLAHHLGAWVMRETIRISERWREEDPDFTAWFNVSQRELVRPLLAQRLEDVPSGLRGMGVEITEGAVSENAADMAHAIAMLRESGFAIALDDFGTGYSSLSHLRRLPIDVVKIDRSFVAGIPDNKHDVAIVEAITSIARRYGYSTVAEGVETPQHAAFLSAEGCTHGQGYLYAPPMPAETFEGWLRESAQSANGDARRDS